MHVCVEVCMCISLWLYMDNMWIYVYIINVFETVFVNVHMWYTHITHHISFVHSPLTDIWFISTCCEQYYNKQLGYRYLFWGTGFNSFGFAGESGWGGIAGLYGSSGLGFGKHVTLFSIVAAVPFPQPGASQSPQHSGMQGLSWCHEHFSKGVRESRESHDTPWGTSGMPRHRVDFLPSEHERIANSWAALKLILLLTQLSELGNSQSSEVRFEICRETAVNRQMQPSMESDCGAQGSAT